MDPQSHSAYLLQQLQEQRIQGLLCDCTLVVKGVCFKAHKNVLAAFSNYFRSLFQTQRCDVFNLVIQDVSGIGQLLDYMYTSRLDVNPENVLALMDMAQFLQMPIVQGLCQSFLKPCLPTTQAPTCPTLSSEQDCSLPNDLDMSDTHRALSEFSQSNPPKPKAVSQSAESPPLHGYKLRNFYSRQYFKQMHNAAREPEANPQPAAILSPVLNQPSTASPGLNPSPTPNAGLHALAPAPALNPPLDRPVQNAALTDDNGQSELSRTVRPKKTVYLKKYNYLRSQKTVEESALCPTLATPQEPTVPPAAETEAQQEPGTESEPQNPTHKPDSPRNQIFTANSLENQTLTPDPPGIPALTPDPPDEPESAPALPPTGQRQYCCSDCGKVFKHPSNLELHKRSHTGEKPFQCNVCGKHFSQAGNLQTHLRRHSGEKPYICELCGKGFTASGDVQRHKVVHTGERPHLCDICGKGFNNLSNLKEHKRTHSTELSFTCDQCGKSFNAPRKLHKHKSRHVGEKPHSCSTCGKSFVGSGDLQRHFRSHTGEKPYVCSECNRSFSRSALLRRHRTLHCKGLPQTSAPYYRENPNQLTEPHHGDDQSKATSPHRHDNHPETHTDSAHTELLPKPVRKSPSGQTLSSTLSPFGAQPEPALPPHLLPERNQNLQHQNYNQSHSPAPGLSEIQPLNPSPQSRQCVNPGCSFTEESTSLGGRAREGQLMSSVSLWGLAMKTLQNDTD